MMAVAIIVVALAITGFYFWNTRRKPSGSTSPASPEDLFAELCDAHELSKADKQLIVQVARACNVTQPAAVFVDPWTLDKASAAADPDAPRYRALRQKLFGATPVATGTV